ncbi:MAG: patatin-like phospholipase family protein [Patescibacteria group bacterium]
MIADLGKIGWIEDGGGFRGAFAVGASSVLWEHYSPDYMQGVSVGALTAAKLAESRNPAELEAIWKNYIEKGGPQTIVNLFAFAVNYLQKNNALFSNQGIYKLINTLDIDKIAHSPIELDVVTINERQNNRSEFFSNKNLTKNRYEHFKRAICASASMMGSFPPVHIGQGLYSDGLNCCVETALRKGCDAIFLFSNSYIWLPPLILPENMDFQKRMRRGFYVEWSKWVLIYLENLLMKHGDLALHVHQDLPVPLANLASHFKRGGNTRKIIFIAPAKIIPGLSTLKFKYGDITSAINDGKQVAGRLLKQL